MNQTTLLSPDRRSKHISLHLLTRAFSVFQILEAHTPPSVHLADGVSSLRRELNVVPPHNLLILCPIGFLVPAANESDHRGWLKKGEATETQPIGSAASC